MERAGSKRGKEVRKRPAGYARQRENAKKKMLKWREQTEGFVENTALSSFGSEKQTQNKLDFERKKCRSESRIQDSGKERADHRGSGLGPGGWGRKSRCRVPGVREKKSRFKLSGSRPPEPEEQVSGVRFQISAARRAVTWAYCAAAGSRVTTRPSPLPRMRQAGRRGRNGAGCTANQGANRDVVITSRPSTFALRLKADFRRRADFWTSRN
jgi:hypothetical protein